MFTRKYDDQQTYIVDATEIKWKDYKNICKQTCKYVNGQVKNLGSWASGGDPSIQIKRNNLILKSHLLIAKPQKRNEKKQFIMPNFSCTGIHGIPMMK
jgi:hypothetical protein